MSVPEAEGDEVVHMVAHENEGARWLECADKRQLAAYGLLLGLRFSMRNVRSVVQPYAFMRRSIEGLPSAALPLLASEWDLLLARTAAPFATATAAAAAAAAASPMAADSMSPASVSEPGAASPVGASTRAAQRISTRSLSMPPTLGLDTPPTPPTPLTPTTGMAPLSHSPSTSEPGWSPQALRSLQPLQRSSSMDLLSPRHWQPRAIASSSDGETDTAFAARAQVAQRFVRLVDWSSDARVPQRALLPLVRELGLRTSGSKELLICRLLLHLLPLDHKPLELRAAWMRPRAREALLHFYRDHEAASLGRTNDSKRRKLLPARRSDALERGTAATNSNARVPQRVAASSVRVPATVRVTNVTLEASELLPGQQVGQEPLAGARFELRGGELDDDRCFLWGLPAITRAQFAAFVAATTAPAPRHVAPFASTREFLQYSDEDQIELLLPHAAVLKRWLLLPPEIR